MDGSEVVLGQPVVSGGDAAEVLEPAKHALDGVAAAVEIRREAVLPLAVGFRRDVGDAAGVFDLAAHGIAVVAPVAVNHQPRRQTVQQRLCRPAIGHIAAGQK